MSSFTMYLSGREKMIGGSGGRRGRADLKVGDLSKGVRATDWN